MEVLTLPMEEFVTREDLQRCTLHELTVKIDKHPCSANSCLILLPGAPLTLAEVLVGRVGSARPLHVFQQLGANVGEAAAARHIRGGPSEGRGCG